MKVSFCAARRFHIAIRIAAGVIASLLTIPLAVFLLLLWFFPGFDFSVSDIFGAIYRFFVRLFCGHALRPLTLHTISSPAGTRRILPTAPANGNFALDVSSILDHYSHSVGLDDGNGRLWRALPLGRRTVIAVPCIPGLSASAVVNSRGTPASDGPGGFESIKANRR